MRKKNQKNLSKKKVVRDLTGYGAHIKRLREGYPTIT